MNKNKFSIKLAEIAAFGTWAMVAGISLYWLSTASEAIQANTAYIILFFLAYIICFISVANELIPRSNLKLTYSFVVAQLFSAFMIMWFLPISFLPILTIIWVALLPNFMSMKKSIFVTSVVMIAWYFRREKITRENVMPFLHECLSYYR